jgi:menaquinone-specific isochorismate synthase
VYWKKRGSDQALMSAGELERFHQVPVLRPNMRLFAALSFPIQAKSSLWKAFPKSYFFLPEFFHEERVPLPDSNLSPREWLVQDRTDSCTLKEWKEQVASCLKSIAEKKVEKIVLGRCTTFAFAESIDAYALLENLHQQASNTTLFAFQPSAECTFLGATPEHLYERNERQLYTEALAGTRRRGTDAAEDLKLELELMHHEKEQREFETVKRFLIHTLEPISDSVQKESKDRVIKTARVQHLYNRLCAELKPNVSDHCLLSCLHPTPAMGGFPSAEALKMIEQLESFDRGWYASPFGWITDTGADFAVAIRSALLQKDKIHLFAAVGIVAGSDAEQEWDELNQKIATFTRYFR